MSQSFTKGIPIDTDGTMAANSDGLVSSQQAIVEYVTANVGTGSGWKFLASATAATSATIDFETDIDSTYYMYCFVFSAVASVNDNTQINMRTSADGGATYDSGATDYSWGGSAGTDYMRVCQGNGNATNENACGRIFLYNPSETNITQQNCHFSLKNSTGVSAIWNQAGFRNSAALVDSVRFYMNSGNIASGTIKMYGCCTPA